VDVDHTPIAADLDSLDTPTGLATNIGQDGKGTYTDSNAVGIADGQIDEVAIWRRALTPQEAAVVHARGVAGVPLLATSIGMPRLSVARTPLGVVISWPVATKAGFKLEGSPALGTNANWQPVAGVSGNSVTVQPSAQYYYRLKTDRHLR
jgi:hypothetical protein